MKYIRRLNRLSFKKKPNRVATASPSVSGSSSQGCAQATEQQNQRSCPAVASTPSTDHPAGQSCDPLQVPAHALAESQPADPFKAPSSQPADAERAQQQQSIAPAALGLRAKFKPPGLLGAGGSGSAAGPPPRWKPRSKNLASFDLLDELPEVAPLPSTTPRQGSSGNPSNSAGQVGTPVGAAMPAGQTTRNNGRDLPPAPRQGASSSLGQQASKDASGGEQQADAAARKRQWKRFVAPRPLERAFARIEKATDESNSSSSNEHAPVRGSLAAAALGSLPGEASLPGSLADRDHNPSASRMHEFDRLAALAHEQQRTAQPPAQADMQSATEPEDRVEMHHSKSTAASTVALTADCRAAAALSGPDASQPHRSQPAAILNDAQRRDEESSWPGKHGNLSSTVAAATAVLPRRDHHDVDTPSAAGRIPSMPRKSHLAAQEARQSTGRKRQLKRLYTDDGSNANSGGHLAQQDRGSLEVSELFAINLKSCECNLQSLAIPKFACARPG